MSLRKTLHVIGFLLCIAMVITCICIPCANGAAKHNEQKSVNRQQEIKEFKQTFEGIAETIAAAENIILILLDEPRGRRSSRKIDELKVHLYALEVSLNELKTQKELNRLQKSLEEKVDKLTQTMKSQSFKLIGISGRSSLMSKRKVRYTLDKKALRLCFAVLKKLQKLLEEKKKWIEKEPKEFEKNIPRLEDSDRKKDIRATKQQVSDYAKRRSNCAIVESGEVTIINKTVTGGKSDTIVWPDHSFKMKIPPGSFPKEHDINISVSLDPSHRIEIPEGYKSLSHTYKITASEKLQEPVILTLKHIGVITITEETKLVAVLHQSEEGTVEVLQGTAAVNSSFFIFQLSQLSWVKIVGAVNISVNYSITFHRREVSGTGTTGQYWTIRVLLSPKKKTLSGSWIIDSLHEHIVPSITVKDEPAILKIKPIGCWTISTDGVTPRIIKVRVNNHELDACGDFTMEWRRYCTDPVSFIRLCDTEGASVYEIFKNPDDIISTSVNWNMAREYILTALAVAIGFISIFIWFGRGLYTCIYHQRKLVVQLEITQLEEVKRSLRQSYFDNTKWKSVGLSLGLYDHTLSAIERNSNNVEECLLKTLSLWLRKADGVEKKGGATRSSLAKALRDNNENAVAERIEVNNFN